MERGLTMSDIKKMQLGQVVDFCIDFNERNEQSEQTESNKSKPKPRRKATQAEIDAFFG